MWQSLQIVFLNESMTYATLTDWTESRINISIHLVKTLHLQTVVHLSSFLHFLRATKDHSGMYEVQRTVPTLMTQSERIPHTKQTLICTTFQNSLANLLLQLAR